MGNNIIMRNATTTRVKEAAVNKNEIVYNNRQAQQILNNLVQITSQQEYDETFVDALINKYEQLTGKKSAME